MKYFLVFSFALVATGQTPAPKECQTVEECRARLAAVSYRFEKLMEQHRTCVGDLFTARIAAAIALPEDLQKKLESFNKPGQVEAKVAKEEKKNITP